MPSAEPQEVCRPENAATPVPSGAIEEDVYTSKVTLARALGENHTVLIDGAFFVEHSDRGGILLSRQEMEAQYPANLVRDIQPQDIFHLRFDPDTVQWVDLATSGTWLLVAISYPWLHRLHPDPHGTQLAKLADFFRRLLADITPHGKRVAAFLDFSSLYQNHPGERTPEQKQLFGIGLKNVNLWYGHQCVVVLALTDTVDDTCANKVPYDGRGWTTFEWKVSLLASDFVFDSRHISSSGAMLTFVGNFMAKKWFGLGALAAARVIADPVTPPRVFDDIVEQKHFTAGKVDCDFVRSKYKQTLQDILGKAERLDYRGVGWSAEDLSVFASEIIPVCASLRELYLDFVEAVSDDFIMAVAQGCPNLQALSLSGCCPLTDASIAAVAGGCPKLQMLDLNGCLELTNASVVAIAQGCPNLQSLDLGSCYRLTDASIAAVARGCANLQRLGLSFCNQLTDASVVAIAQGCPKLQSLNLIHCRRLTDASIAAVAQGCPNLQRLRLVLCVGVSDHAVALVRRHHTNVEIDR